MCLWMIAAKINIGIFFDELISYAWPSLKIRCYCIIKRPHPMLYLQPHNIKKKTERIFHYGV